MESELLLMLNRIKTGGKERSEMINELSCVERSRLNECKFDVELEDNLKGN